MATLPYITAHGNIDRAFTAIKAAATPERVTQDFVKTILKIPGGSGDQVTAFLRKLGFVNKHVLIADHLSITVLCSSHSRVDVRLKVDRLLQDAVCV